MTYHERQEIKNERSRLLDVVPLSQPYVIFLEPSGSCNFSCVFCPCNNSKWNTNNRHQIMDIALFAKIVSDLEAFPEPIKVVESYAFGEPLLNPHIADMVSILKETGKVDTVRITTNGSLLTPSLSKSLIDAGLDYLKISVEALTEEDYKRVCGYTISLPEFIENIAFFYRASRGTGTHLGVKALSNTLSGGQKKGF